MRLVHLGHAFPASWVMRLSHLGHAHGVQRTEAHTQKNAEKKNLFVLRGFREGSNGIQIKKKTNLYVLRGFREG